MEEAVALLPVGPWALAAVSLVLVVALAVPPGGPRTALHRAGPSPVAGRVGAGVALVVAVLAALVARTGPDSDLENPVPALVVGVGWPLLLLLPGLAGLLRPRADDPAGGDDVRPAVPAALALVAFLTVPLNPTAPAAVATAVAAYVLVVVAGAVAFGRGAVAARLEVLGLLARWARLGRALPDWAPPRGATAVLAVVLGGAWFERYERTTSWTAGLPGRGGTVAGLACALLLAAVGAAALHRATRSVPGTAAAVLLPLALACAAAGVARRALISGQLLLDQAIGPRALEPDPFGLAGGQGLALGLVAAGGALAGAVLARRMGQETARLPGLGVLLLLSGVSAWVVLQP